MPTDMKEVFESDEGKAFVASLIEKEVSGLKKKNEELLGSLKREKDAKTDFEKRLDSLEAEKIKAEEEAATKSGDVVKIREQLESRFEKETNTLKAEKENLNNQLQKHVIGEGLTQALVKAKIATPLMDAAKALINTTYKGELGEYNGKPFAKFDGKAVNDFVADWAQSESGKHFVSAGSNTGGGSNGANGSGKASDGNSRKTMSRTEFEALSASEKVESAKQGVSLVDD